MSSETPVSVIQSLSDQLARTVIRKVDGVPSAGSPSCLPRPELNPAEVSLELRPGLPGEGSALEPRCPDDSVHVPEANCPARNFLRRKLKGRVDISEGKSKIR